MTSDQERAAPAQQPVDIKTICTSFFRWWYNQPGANTDDGFDAWASTGEGKRLLSARSEPELRAEIVRLTRERDFEQSSRLTSEAQLGAQIENLIRELDEHRRVRDVYVVSSQEEYIARCRAEQERDELQKRVEALSAEVGKLTEALDEIVRLTRERDELRACEASWEQTRLAIAQMRNENGGLRSRVEALSAALEQIATLNRSRGQLQEMTQHDHRTDTR